MNSGNSNRPSAAWQPVTIPINRETKKPAVKWGDLTASVPIPEGRDTGILTGERSRCVVLDFDVGLKTPENKPPFVANGPHALAKVLGVVPPGADPESAIVALIGAGFLNTERIARTRSGGFHFYFAWPGRQVRNSSKKIAADVDVRGDGGYSKAPPSMGYTWLSEGPMGPMPPWFLKAAKKAGQGVRKERLPDTLDGVCALLVATPKGSHGMASRVGFKAGFNGWPLDVLLVAVQGWDPEAIADHVRTLGECHAAGVAACAARVVIYVGADTAGMVDKASDTLSAEDERDDGVDLTFYQRDGELVRVVQSDDCAPQIRKVSLHTLHERLSVGVSWMKQTEQGPKETTPPERVVAALLDRGIWPDLAALDGISETPIVRPDGTVFSDAGYDDATRLIHAPSVNVGALQDPAAGLATLVDVFRDFPFSSPAARFVPVAAILSLVGRAAIRGACPLFAFDASTRGSGKSLLADVVSMVATGRSASRMTYSSKEEELEKAFDALAFFGARLVCLDNIAAPIGAPVLDKVLTCEDRVSFRVLGKTEIREIPWRAVVLATGNGLSFGADTARRTLIARLEPDCERPEERTDFQHADLLSHVRAHRGALVGAAISVLGSAPRVAGSSWGTFGEWVRVVAGSIVAAGGPDVLACRAASSEGVEPKAQALREITEHLHAIGRPMSASGIVTHAYGSPEGVPWREAIETLAGPGKRPHEGPDPGKLGQALGYARGRIFGGLKLVRVPGRKTLWAAVDVRPGASVGESSLH